MVRRNKSQRAGIEFSSEFQPQSVEDRGGARNTLTLTIRPELVLPPEMDAVSSDHTERSLL